MSRPINTDNRERILEVARCLIYKNGFNSVSMDDIAVKAALKKANLFHYYPTKEELGLAVFEYATRDFHEKWSARFQADVEPVELVEEMFDGTRRGMQKQGCGGGCLIGNLAQELSDSNEKFRRKISALWQGWHRQLTTYFSRYKAAGYFRKSFDSYAGAEAVLALYQGSLLFCKATRRARVINSSKQMVVCFLKASKG